MRYQSYESPLSLFDVIGAVYRFKWRVMLVVCLTLGASAAAILLCPKKYESEAKLFVRLGRGSASLDPTAVGQTISIQESRETEMNSMIDLLGSRSLAERIVTEIGTDRLLEKHAWIEKEAERLADLLADKIQEYLPTEEDEGESGAGLTEEELERQTRFELAVREVQSNLRIESPKRSTTIGIRFRAREPELAKQVVESTIKNYRDLHIAAYQSDGTLEFFDQQFQQQQELVSATEDSLRESKNQNNVVTMRGKQESLQSEITDVKKMQLQTKADLQAALAKVKELEQDMLELDQEIVASKTSGIASNATDSMRNRLYELEIQEKELASKYVATDPRLVRVRNQLEDARRIVEQQPNEKPQSVVSVNPVRQQVENELLIAKASAASLTAKSKALNELEQELLERLADVNNLEVATEDLQRQIDIARENHRSYARKLEESRINAALDAELLSNISVVGAPTVRYKHVSPKRSLLAALGGAVSLLMGLTVAMLSDYSRNARELALIRKAERNTYLRRLEHAQRLLDSPEAIDELEFVPVRRQAIAAVSPSGSHSETSDMSDEQATGHVAQQDDEHSVDEPDPQRPSKAK